MDVGSVSVQWFEGGVSKVEVALKWVRSVNVVRSGGEEALVIDGISGIPMLRWSFACVPRSL